MEFCTLKRFETIKIIKSIGLGWAPKHNINHVTYNQAYQYLRKA